jgi:hypothetical protein
MIAAGINAMALSTYTGHATIGITLDRYRHLMPRNQSEAAGALDAYLAPSAGVQDDGCAPRARQSCTDSGELRAIQGTANQHG